MAEMKIKVFILDKATGLRHQVATVKNRKELDIVINEFTRPVTGYEKAFSRSEDSPVPTSNPFPEFDKNQIRGYGIPRDLISYEK